MDNGHVKLIACRRDNFKLGWGYKRSQTDNNGVWITSGVQLKKKPPKVLDHKVVVKKEQFFFIFQDFT